MEEVWKNITGFEGQYQVSNLGNVKSLQRLVPSPKGFRTIKEKLLTKTVNRFGYHQVSLTPKGSLPKTFRVHCLVAKEFLTKENHHTEINHLNGIKTDNRVENLEWCTSSENKVHFFKVLGRKRNRDYKKTKRCPL